MKKSSVHYAGYFLALIFAFSTVMALAGAPPVQEIFSKKCGLCHDLPDPNAYSRAEWVKYVNSMAPRARLTSEEKTAIMGLNTGK